MHTKRTNRTHSLDTCMVYFDKHDYDYRRWLGVLCYTNIHPEIVSAKKWNAHLFNHIYFRFQFIRIEDNPIRHTSPYWLRGTKPGGIWIFRGKLKQAPSISNTVVHICFCNQKIVNVTRNYFNDCTRLRLVHFFKNRFQALPNLLPIALRLRDLDFSRNFITDITSLQTTKFPRVKRIALQRNRITHFVLDWGKLPKLEWINLAYNRLTEIDELYKTVSAFSVPESTIFISSNPWNCSHVYTWVFQSMHIYGDLAQSSDCKIDGLHPLWFPTKASKTIICDHSKAFCHSPPTLVKCTLYNGKEQQHPLGKPLSVITFCEIWRLYAILIHCAKVERQWVNDSIPDLPKS